ncbi:MAG TPA: AsmA family protein, partial [Acidocella sp.]|nr:AsmA family protein [Acidocella sp.]
MRRNIWLRILLALAIVVTLLAIFWNWDWFIPAVDAQASAALGRKVTVQHLHVGLGAPITVTASGVTIANPENFPADDPPLATVDRLAVKVKLMDYVMHRRLSLTAVEIDHPVVNIRQLPGGANNYTLKSSASSRSTSQAAKLGNLIINNGTASVILPAQKTDFNLAIQTRNAPSGTKVFTHGEIVVDVHGTYADAPITGQLIGGALLSLRKDSAPYPVDFHLQNGTTRAHLAGTIKDPVNFAGAHLRLSFSGQNMANLYQLTGVPIPATPPFTISGDLDYSGHAVRFKNLSGRVGSSDLEGAITEAPGSPRRLITANLHSRHVDL